MLYKKNFILFLGQRKWSAGEILKMIEDGNISEFEDSDDDNLPNTSFWKKSSRIVPESSDSEDDQLEELPVNNASSDQPGTGCSRASSDQQASSSVTSTVQPGAVCSSVASSDQPVCSTRAQSQKRSSGNCSNDSRKKTPSVQWCRNDSFIPIYDVRNSIDDCDSNVRENWTPSQYFCQFVSNEIYATIAECTNVRHVELKGKSLNLTAEDIQKFFGMTLLMSNFGYPWIKMFWASETRVPIIAETMPREKYFSIRSNLKVVIDADVSNESKANDKLWKVRPVLDEVRKGCLMIPRPPHVSIDEQMIPFTGTTLLKQYVVGKPNPVGLKNFVLASPDGMVLDFSVYQGKNTFPLEDNRGQFTVAESAVVKLCETVPPGTCVYFDRWFTTEKLIVYLKSKGIYGTGTIMKNRLPKCEFTSDKEMSKMARGTMEQFVRSDEIMCATKWFDKKAVTIISSAYGTIPEDNCKRWCKKEKKVISVPRPQCVQTYNQYMGGVDLADRMLAYYRMKARTNKWTVRAVLHFIDLAVANAWQQYRADCRSKKKRAKDIMKFLQFRMKLAEEQIKCQASNATEETSEDSDSEYEVPPVAKRQKLPPINFRVKGQHMPQFVDLKNPNKCRREGCSGKTRVQCMRCHLFLCLHKNKNCFAAFHGEVITGQM